MRGSRADSQDGKTATADGQNESTRRVMRLCAKEITGQARERGNGGWTAGE